MNIDRRRMCARMAAGLGLLAATAIVGLVRPLPAAAAAKDDAIIADWPEASRRTALAMIETNGTPDRREEDALTWLGLYDSKRTVIHRASDGEGIVEMAVNYKVPQSKIAELRSFDPRIKVDRSDAEMSVRTGSVRTDLLVLNLAHEVASGFRSAVAARGLRDKELRLAETGKSSRYRESLLFEGALPYVRPRLPVLPGEERDVPRGIDPESLRAPASR